jgi:predicted  nucleic acid-binding Zn-ribbon protein
LHFISDHTSKSRGLPVKCPKCGYRRRNSDSEFVPADECPACGIVYSKHTENEAEASATGTGNSEPMLRPSPVDAESLKKARERVDRRLNERLAEQKRDARHDQTLELARRLASEGVRQRQEQWKQNQVADSNPVNVPEADKPSSPPTPYPPDDDMDRNLQESLETAPGPEGNPPDAAVAATDTSGTDTDASIQANAAEAIETVPEEPELVAAAMAASPDSMPDDQMHPDPTAMFKEDDTVLIMEADTPGNDPTSWIDEPKTTSDQSVRRTRRQWLPKWGLSRLLPVVAWLILIAGISGAILSWTTLTEAEANIQPQSIGIAPTMNVGLLLGFAYLVTGVLGFAFFWVSSLISRQLKDIRRLLLLQPPSAGQPAGARLFETNEDNAVTGEDMPISTK